MGELDIDALKRKVDSRQLEGWKAWFGCYSPGGVRTPSDEIIDVLNSRLVSILLGAFGNSKTVRDVMLFPPPVTQEEVNMRIEHAKGCLRGALAAIPKLRKVPNV